MSEIEKLKEIINKLIIENLLTRLLAIITMCSFAIFVLYITFAEVFDMKAAVLVLGLAIQIVAVEIFIMVNK